MKNAASLSWNRQRVNPIRSKNRPRLPPILLNSRAGRVYFSPMHFSLFFLAGICYNRGKAAQTFSAKGFARCLFRNTAEFYRLCPTFNLYEKENGHETL